MTDALFLKNVILKQRDYNLKPIHGMDIIHRKSENKEDYATLTGTKQQINSYLQDAPVLSDRLRTLNNLPKFRLINTTKVRIQ